MTKALAILDEIGAPGEIGSILDLAISKLEKRLGREGSDVSALLENALTLTLFEAGT